VQLNQTQGIANLYASALMEDLCPRNAANIRPIGAHFGGLFVAIMSSRDIWIALGRSSKHFQGRPRQGCVDKELQVGLVRRKSNKVDQEQKGLLIKETHTEWDPQ